MGAGLIAIGSLVVIQLVAFAFGYGKLTQKVKDICHRLNDLSHRLERIENRER